MKISVKDFVRFLTKPRFKPLIHYFLLAGAVMLSLPLYMQAFVLGSQNVFLEGFIKILLVLILADYLIHRALRFD